MKRAVRMHIALFRIQKCERLAAQSSAEKQQEKLTSESTRHQTENK